MYRMMASSAGAGNADGSAGEADCNTSGDDGAGAGAGAGASASGILDTTVIITPRSDSNRHELPPQQIDARVEDGALSLTQVELTAPNTPPRGGGGGGGRGRPANPLIEPVSDYRPGLRDGDEGAAGDDLNITQTVHSDPQFGTMTLLSSADGAGAGAGKQEQQTQPSSSSPRRPPAQTTAAAQARAGTYSPNTRLQMLDHHPVVYNPGAGSGSKTIVKVQRQRRALPGTPAARTSPLADYGSDDVAAARSSTSSPPPPPSHTAQTGARSRSVSPPTSPASATARPVDDMEDMCNFDGFQLSCIDLELEAIPSTLALRYGRLARRLDLSSNKLCNLANLRKFLHLEDLVLDNNRISDDAFFLPPLPNLVALSLNKNRISNLDSFLDVVSVSCPNLTFLSLVSNPACPNELVWGKDEDDYIRYRCMVVSRVPTLKFLDSLRVTQREYKASQKSIGLLGKMAGWYSGSASGTGPQYADHSTATLSFFKGRKRKKRWSMWLSKQCVLGLAPLSDKWIVTGGTDASIRVFDLTPGKWENKCVAILKGHTSRVRAVACFADVRVVSCGDDKTIRIWDLGAQKCLRVYKGHTAGVGCVIALPDGRVVSGGDDGAVRVWSASSKRCAAILTGHHGAVLSVAKVGARHIASGSSDETIKVWDISGNFCRRTLKGHTGDVNSLVILPNQKLVSASADKTIKIWNPLESNGPVRTYMAGGRSITVPEIGTFEASLQGHTGAVTSVSALSDTRILSASDDKMVAIWDLTTLACVSVFAGHEDAVVDAIWLPDGRVASSSRDIKIWDRMTHAAQAQSERITDEFNSVGEAPASSLWQSTRTGLKGLMASMVGANKRSSSSGSATTTERTPARPSGSSSATPSSGAAAATPAVPPAYSTLSVAYPSTIGMFATVIPPVPVAAAPASRGRSSGSDGGRRRAAETEAEIETTPEQSKARNLMNVLFSGEGDKWISLPNNVLWDRVKSMQQAVRKKKGPKVIHWLGIFKARQAQDLVARLDEMCRVVGVERITYLAVKQTLVEEFGEEIFERMKEQVSVELAMREFELTNGGSTSDNDKRLDNLASPKKKSYFPETNQGGGASKTPNKQKKKTYSTGDESVGSVDLDDGSVQHQATSFLTDFFQGQENYATQSDVGDDEDLRSRLDETMVELDAGSPGHYKPMISLPAGSQSEPADLFKAALPNSTFFADVADPFARFNEPEPEPEPENEPDPSLLNPNFKLRKVIEI